MKVSWICRARHRAFSSKIHPNREINSQMYRKCTNTTSFSSLLVALLALHGLYWFVQDWWHMKAEIMLKSNNTWLYFSDYIVFSCKPSATLPKNQPQDGFHSWDQWCQTLWIWLSAKPSSTSLWPCANVHVFNPCLVVSMDILTQIYIPFICNTHSIKPNSSLEFDL